jgi:hypothetical protein
MRKAIRVVDDSVNLVFQQGEFAIFEPWPAAAEIEATTDKVTLYVIERTRGDLLETSIRRALKRKDGTLALVSHCSPSLPEEITIPEQKGPERIKVIGRVVGKYIDF